MLGSHSGYFPTWKKPRYPLEKRLIGPRIGLDALTKRKVFASARNLTLIIGRLVDILSLCRLGYPSPMMNIYLTKICCIFKITNFIQYGNSGRESLAHVWGPCLWASNYSRGVTTDVWAGTLSCSDSSKTGRGCRSNLQIHCNYHIIRIGGAVYCPSTEAVYVNGVYRIIPCPLQLCPL